MKEEEEKRNALPILSNVFAGAANSIKSNFRILILGGTGDGKTSFLNLIANVGYINPATNAS